MVDIFPLNKKRTKNKSIELKNSEYNTPRFTYIKCRYCGSYAINKRNIHYTSIMHALPCLFNNTHVNQSIDHLEMCLWIFELCFFLPRIFHDVFFIMLSLLPLMSITFSNVAAIDIHQSSIKFLCFFFCFSLFDQFQYILNKRLVLI